MFLVAVPSEDNRSADRVVPGRKDVYIIPQSSCEEGTVLDDSDTGRYYPNSMIKACLILKVPEEAVLAPARPVRVKCSSSCDSHGGMADFQMALAGSERLKDELDTAHGFPPRVTAFTATLAPPPTADYLALHRLLEKEQASKKLWLENVARFKPEEMVAGVQGVKSQLLHAYTIAYIFKSNVEANKVCQAGGVVATETNDGAYALTVSLQSPADLGWRKNAGGNFRQNVAQLMDMASVDEVQTVIILGIPNQAIEEYGCTQNDKVTFTERASDLKLMQPAEGGKAIYSSAHIAKVYELEPDALVELRRELSDRVAADATHTELAALRLRIKELEEEVHENDADDPCAKE